MLTAAALCIGASLTLAGWPMLADLFHRPAFRRRNYRGRDVATAGGLLLVLAVVLGEVVLSAAGRVGDVDLADRDARRGVVVAVVGFGLLGLLDDLTGDTSTTGYRGHLQALLRGEVTTGVLKILGGAVVSLVAVAIALEELSVPFVLLDATAVALTANVTNLLDRRPGRVGKTTVVVGSTLCVAAGFTPDLAGTALVVGAAGGLLVPDLREELMVGDTGANPMGAALGLGVVLVAPSPWIVVWLLAALALNLASERVSFTAVIEGNRVLRRLDELGRRGADLP
jgi:UDP-N-acetylmuramyl pentapeptide phosphotransferase/UDP-N-acetylglucosamine-1-phosphate transferase